MGWWIALAVLVALAVLPLGASVRYDADGVRADIIIGPARIRVFPREKKQESDAASKQEEKSEEKPEKPSEEKKAADKPEIKKKPSGGSVTDFLPLVRMGLDALGSLRRKLRVPCLELKIILGGSDPCDVATSYGRAWAALGNLMPQLERFLVIGKRDVEVECSFTSETTLITARLDITITLGRIIALAVVYGLRAFKEYSAISKKRKGGANHESKATQYAGKYHSKN